MMLYRRVDGFLWESALFLFFEHILHGGFPHACEIVLYFPF
jgi:hypothetical protein